jgi:hypothetical protein
MRSTTFDKKYSGVNLPRPKRPKDERMFVSLGNGKKAVVGRGEVWLTLWVYNNYGVIDEENNAHK